jgi:chorismate lyase
MYGWENLPFEKINPRIKAWLSHEGNLTAKLKTLGQHQMTVVSQSVLSLPEIENQLLHQTNKTGCVRHIMHLIDSKIVVAARTVISQQLYEHYQDIFDHLDQQPIGQTFLYTNPDIVRDNFEYGLIRSPSQILTPFEAYFIPDHPLPARRSIFTKANMTLMITEIFLPVLTHYDY